MSHEFGKPYTVLEAGYLEGALRDERPQLVNIPLPVMNGSSFKLTCKQAPNNATHVHLTMSSGFMPKIFPYFYALFLT